jgi:L-rhamnose mutarotase
MFLAVFALMSRSRRCERSPHRARSARLNIGSVCGARRLTKELSMAEQDSGNMAEAESARVQRICFQLQVKPDRIADYVERHRAVWPEMLAAIHDAGRRNYSLYLRDDGMLIGYYETDDDAASAAALAADPRTAEWEESSTDLFVSLRGDRADQSAVQLREVFHLEDQLAALHD